MPNLRRTIVDECIEKFQNARGSVADAIESLYHVHKTEAWVERYGSFSEFCEEGLKISKSLGSQYVAIYGRYIEEGGLTVERLRDVDTAKLYRALKQPGTPQEQYAIATTWSRNDFRDDKKEDGHEHQWAEYCGVCWKKRV